MQRPPTREPWTEEEEALLNTLKADNVDLKDTALGVAAKQMATTVTHNTETLDLETRNMLLKSLAEHDFNANAPKPPDPDKKKTKYLFYFTLDEALQPSRLFRRSHTDRSR